MLKHLFLAFLICVGMFENFTAAVKMGQKSNNNVRDQFVAGRIPPSRFEFADKNGLYRVDSAVKFCEANSACAGFTFKGTPMTTGKLSKRKYEIYFFHFVPPKVFQDVDKQFYHWTSYLVKSRSYVKLLGNGISRDSKTFRNGYCLPDIRNFVDVVQRKSPTRSLSKKQFSILHLNGEGHWSSYQALDFSDLTSKENGTLWIDLDSNSVSHSFAAINRCCKKPPPEFGYDGIDDVSRISCNISKSDFVKRYIERREAVILTGCGSQWRASNWTLDYILESFPDFWSATFQTSTMKTSDNVLLKSAAVYDLFQNGTDVKLFCRICRKTMNSDGPNEILLKKVAMKQDYSNPTPLPDDLYSVYDVQSIIDHGYFMAGTKGTGTQLHVDPDVTDAWNAVVVGSKWWAYFPKDVYEAREDFSCDPACSRIEEHDLHNAALWMYNILTQIRQRKFYGRQIKTVLQKAGEVIFMPHFIEHIVYNPEFSLAVGENMFFSAALEEVVVSLNPDSKKELFDKVTKPEHLLRMKVIEHQTKSNEHFKAKSNFNTY